MSRMLLLSLALMLAACGVQRPLMKPKDIPAYREEQRQKREKLDQEQRDDAAKAAARAAQQEAK